MAKNNPAVDAVREQLVHETLEDSYGAVSRYLAKVKFAPKLLGVDPVDVWRKIEKLCELYECAIEDARARADALEARLRELEPPAEIPQEDQPDG